MLDICEWWIICKWLIEMSNFLLKNLKKKRINKAQVSQTVAKCNFVEVIWKSYKVYSKKRVVWGGFYTVYDHSSQF